MKSLWEATRDQHHACEAHAVGAAMSKGNPPRQWYSDWLGCLFMVHEVIDEDSSPIIGRVDRIRRDIQMMEVKPRTNTACTEYCSQLRASVLMRQGALYVLTGAHLMGGEIMRRRLDGYPTLHLEWDDRQKALGELKHYRERSELASQARACFESLIQMMDEIESKGV